MSSSTSVPAPGEVPASGGADSADSAAERADRTTGSMWAVAGTRLGPWWLCLVLGIAWVLYGMLVLSLRPGSVYSVVLLAGFAFIFGGISQFVIAQRVDSWQWLFYVGGVLGILAGIMAFAWPAATLRVLAVFVAWYLAIGGIFSIVAAFAGPKRDWWWLGLVTGVLMFMLGIWAIGSPLRELLLFINLVGIYMVFFGVSEIFAAFSLRSEKQATGTTGTGTTTATA
jgi:uncharacterized membrane protein HdeD (DUF308 family)